MMSAKEYLARSRLFRRLKSGPHGQFIGLYAARLTKDGLARHGTWRSLSLVGDLLTWVAGSRSKVTDLDERVAERYLRQRARKQSIQPGDRAALKRLLSVLRDAGMIPPAALPPVTPEDRIFEEFGDYLRRERGLAPKSIIHRLSADSYMKCALPAQETSARSARGTSPATSSATPGTAARRPGRGCVGRCAHFSDTYSIAG
jgi:hypothetical protein